MSIIDRIRAHAWLPILDGSLHRVELKRVPPDITVSVTHNKTAIAGIEVSVVPANSVGAVFNGTTDEHGLVHIRHLARGKYFLSASHAGFEAGREWIEVVWAGAHDTTNYFQFNWDSDYETRRVAGTLTGLAPGETGNEWMDIVHPVKAVYGGVTVTLRNAFGTDEYRTVSDRNGEFLIDHVPDGIYVLTIEGGEQAKNGTADVTSRLVDVRSSIVREYLPLELRSTVSNRTEFALREN